MKRTLPLLLVAVLCAAPVDETAAGRAQTPGARADAGPGALSESERELVRSSRAAIIRAGFSEPFFDRHFSPLHVVDRPGDRRVVWRFRAHGHETVVNDSVGSHLDPQGSRVNTHSVSATLAGARDIRRAITRRRAERIMRACIGPFEGGSVVFQQFGPRPRAALVFTAATPAPEPAAQTTPRPEEPAGQADRRRRGGKKSPPPYLGAVDLETGRCLKGRAQAGSPRPEETPRRD